MKSCIQRYSMEWSKEHQYNSFNSLKGLLYYEIYKKIMSWMNCETNYLPSPVECNLDPMAECNIDCYFCITQRYLRASRDEVGEMRKLPTDYMYKLVDFISKWGVRGFCISGGGEPSLHEGTWKLPSYVVNKGMDCSYVTNGVNISNELAENLMCCRWVSISVDSGDRETYKIVKGKDKFDDVIENISKLSNFRVLTNSKVDLCYKFLVLPENQYSIYDTCKLAKELGVQDFHVRPVDFERKDIKGHKKLSIDVIAVNHAFMRCHELENDNFRVYTVTHKFDPEFHVKHDFKRCLATPLIMPLLTDGNAYLCVDKKMEERFKVGSGFPDPEKILDWWGSDKHRELIKSVNIDECSRCTWSQYNRQIEEVVCEDKMCLSFP